MDLLKSIFKGDKVIWIIFLFLCLISITEVFSAASTLTYKSGDHWGPITQHSIILMVGAVIVVLMHNIPYMVSGIPCLPVAVTMITAILAISEGWNCMPMNVIQRAAPLIRSIIMTSISSIAEAGNRKTGATNSRNT